MKLILIVDDNRDTCLLLKQVLLRQGFDAITAYSGQKALTVLESTIPDLIISDFQLGDMDATAMLEQIRQADHHIPVIVISGHHNTKSVVEVMRLGASDFILKPLNPEELLLAVHKVLEVPAPSLEASSEDRTKTNGQSEDLIFNESEELSSILEQIYIVGPTNYSVIIYGESGSGKEAIARQIHKHSSRSNKPFVAIDCGTLSKELAASELFGHEKGAFTGAVSQKIGSFEMANEGTILLDEVANLHYDVQIALLRVIQERKIKRVGGTKDIDLDVRIIVASNEKLWHATAGGKLREDLYHRFNEFQIDVPPLRERKNDVLLFAHHFLNHANKELQKHVLGFSDEVKALMKSYSWPGNLRELKNVVKRAALLTSTDIIGIESIPPEIHTYKTPASESAYRPSASFKTEDDGFMQQSTVKTTIEIASARGFRGASIHAEYKIIMEALLRVNYNKSKAARLLNIDRKTLYNKMKAYFDLMDTASGRKEEV